MVRPSSSLNFNFDIPYSDINSIKERIGLLGDYFLKIVLTIGFNLGTKNFKEIEMNTLPDSPLSKTIETQILIHKKNKPKEIHNKNCKECNAENSYENLFCEECGVKFPEDTIKLFCPECNTENKFGSIFCGNCGAKLEE
ncbi:MAG: zinc ribbon domain-containing protein [Candidatus Thermoplasmatota archaeon]|nr:zinc ribbon domain-containing protein [Candidatus Thermoplasmatota archaeon]